MPMLNYSKPDSFEICWVHAMACYCLIDSSVLNRNVNQNNDFVFLKLHNVSDNTVSKDLTQVIRECLPPDLSEKIRNKFSCKSWRKGGIAQMSAHPGLEDKHCCARSGHKMGVNHYKTHKDSCGIRILIPAALSLNECENIHQIPFPFTFESRYNSTNNNHPGNEKLLKIT